jgi:hypothetical protein
LLRFEARCRSRQFEYRRLNEFGGGGAVAPARIWATSIGATDTTEIRWRGHGEGAALALVWQRD